MSARSYIQDVYGYLFAGLVWMVLATASGSLPWAIIGGFATSGLAFAVSRQWKNTLALGVFAAGVISVLGVMAMLSPGWYKNLL